MAKKVLCDEARPSAIAVFGRRYLARYTESPVVLVEESSQGERYTPPSSAETSPSAKGHPPSWDTPKFSGKVNREHEYVDSTSHYQQGPGTYLLQLRDVDFPRLRQYIGAEYSFDGNDARGKCYRKGKETVYGCHGRGDR